MAEALGLAASVISVASFAVQLADSVQKACDFWELLEDAPKDIEHISKELKLLSGILRFISREHGAGVTDAAHDSLVMSTLEVAKKDINELTDVITHLASKIDPERKGMKKKWGQVQVALKAGKISKLQTHIESAKSSLIMLQATRALGAISQMNRRMSLLATNISMSTQTMQQLLAPETTDMSIGDPEIASPAQDGQGNDGIESVENADANTCTDSRLWKRTKTTWTSINAGLALLSFQSSTTTYADPEEEQEHENTSPKMRKTFTVNFLWGFSSCRRGFRVSANSPFDSLKLDVVRRRPSDSLIFNLCYLGDTVGVRKLLDSGQASIFDVTESGRGLLHIACRNGRSDLAKLLMCSGIDCYMQSDEQRTAVDELDICDENSIEGSRKEITRITNTLVRETIFDPFHYTSRQNGGNTTLTLWHGLPYDDLQYLLLQDSRLHPVKDQFNLLYENLVMIEDFVNDFKSSVDLMLTKYEILCKDLKTLKQWPFNRTMLQYLTSRWLFHSKTRDYGSEYKVRRCLLLTTDLYRRQRKGGTPLDTIVAVGREYIQPWLKLLVKNDINISEYLQYEFDLHPDKVLHQRRYTCCRTITLNFHWGGNGLTGVEAESFCHPDYVHFHPHYRCEAWIRRKRCITKFPDKILDESGKPKQSIPGGWSETLIPNSECFLVLRNRCLGKEYVEILKGGELVWDDEEGEWYYYHE